jgi:hypothetical protein
MWIPIFLLLSHWRAWLAAGLIGIFLAAADGNQADAASSGAAGETIEQALCRLIDGAGAKEHLPAEFLTRLLWQESSFRAGVTSPAGAQGIAQFMPGTARERGLADPFDPEQAIPASAALLADLLRRFGNLGLAAAAYNGGPARVAAWLDGTGGLPSETQDYVLRVTRRTAEDWAADAKKKVDHKESGNTLSCMQTAGDLRLARGSGLGSTIALAPLAPWGVQLAGNFSKALALASFDRARRNYEAVLSDVQPMIIGTRLRTRGSRAFYRVRVPAETRAAANALCSRIHSMRGSCMVLRS